VGPQVSVVIPSFNHRQFVTAAIKSVLAQTVTPMELIIIDDGSVDGSAATLREAVKDKRARVITRSQNLGAHATINEGIGHARGDYIAILNSDDLYAPTRLERILAQAESSGSELVFSDLCFIDAKGRHIPHSREARGYARTIQQMAGYSIEEALVRGCLPVTTSNLVFRRSLIERIGLFRAFRFCHDYDFLLRLLGKCRVTWLHEPLLSYRLHADNTSKTQPPWQRSLEVALAYVCFIIARANDGLPVCSDFVLSAEHFEPLIVTWLFTEASRIGVDQLIAENRDGTLHMRAAPIFKAHGIDPDARLSARRIVKHANRDVRRRLVRFGKTAASWLFGGPYQQSTHYERASTDQEGQAELRRHSRQELNGLG
jgi:GT2 family glycosyltransferase